MKMVDFLRKCKIISSSSSKKSFEIVEIPSEFKTEETETEHCEGKCHPLVMAVIDFYSRGSFFLLVPFHVKMEKGKDKELKFNVQNRNVLFQILLVLNHLFSLTMILWFTFFYPQEDESPASKKNDKSWMNQFTAGKFILFMWSLCMANTLSTLWMRKNHFSKFLKDLNTVCTSLKKFRVKLPAENIVRLVSILLSLLLFLWVLMDNVKDLGLHKYTPQVALEHVQNEAETWFGLRPHQNSSSVVHLKNSDSGKSWVSKFCTFLVILAQILWQFTSHWADTLCFLYALLLFLIIYSFVGHIEKNFKNSTPSKSQVKAAIRIFDELRELCESLDKVIGTVLFSSCFGLLPFYCFKLGSVFQDDYLNIMQFSLYAITFGSTLALAAEAHGKMGAFVLWLETIPLVESSTSEISCTSKENDIQVAKYSSVQDQLEFNGKINSIQNQFQRNAIGLKGKTFTITYGFVGNMAGLIVTYTIIIVQIQSKDAKN